ncbi:flagellar hook-associated protein FlgL [Alkalibacillus aidingensis]|uniref:flagellar hook-associated protein FlgL n=1 Tax=Alkalibacillus aidingensis TaxID=2747607 RepID=UPI0016607B26|nr:flagellar hook-associated protein FlgL [Alkalibacillus aidingensis]
MRVTQGMMNNNMINNLRQNYSNMDKYMEQLSTGKKINRPSDDPVVAMKGVDYRSELSKVKQFERNMSEVRSWMDSSDEAMNEAGQGLNRVRELMIQAKNGTYEENQRENMASEVEEIKNHLIELSNTKVNNKYIFNGTNTTEKRFDVDNEGEVQVLNDEGEWVAYDGNEDVLNNEDVMIEVSDGVELKANINPENAFSAELFDDLDGVVDSLRNDGIPEDEEVEVFGEYLDRMDDHLQSLVNERADLGARMNRADLIESRLSQQEVTTSQLMSDNEDAHMEEVIMNLQLQENVHRATLGAGSRIIQPTLMDFLR